MKIKKYKEGFIDIGDRILNVKNIEIIDENDDYDFLDDSILDKQFIFELENIDDYDRLKNFDKFDIETIDEIYCNCKILTNEKDIRLQGDIRN